MFDLLPKHPTTGLKALGVLPSGRIVWPVMGGDRTNDAGAGNSGGEGGGGTGAQGGNGGQGGGGEGGGTGGEGGEGGGEQSFTQADVDRIVSQRLRRARQEFGDYDDLKAKAAKYDEAQAANKTELERERDRAAAAERERDEATSRAQQTMVRSEIAVHAAAAGAVDVADVVALLAGSADITVGKDGQVQGAQDAVKEMAKAKPHLFNTGGGSGGGFEQGARRGGGERASVARGRELYEQSRKKR